MNITSRLPRLLVIYIISQAIPLTTTTAELYPDSKKQLAELEIQEIVGPYIQVALAQNHELKAHYRNYLAARTTISAASALPNPKIQLTHFIESVQTRTGPQKQAISIQQPIPWVEKLQRNRDSAEAKAIALWHAYSAQQFKLIDRVSKIVLERAFLEQTLEINVKNLNLLKNLETIVEERVKSGGKLSDLLKLQIEIEQSLDSIEAFKTTLSVKTYTLNRLLGQNPNTKISKTKWDAPLPLDAEEDAWLIAINEHSPQLAILRAIKSDKNTQQRLAKLSNKPDFNIGLNYINTGNSPTLTTSENGKDPWAILVGISLPINRKMNSSLIREANLNSEAITSQISDLTLSLATEGNTLISKLKDSSRRITTYKTKLIPLAKQSLEITKSSYQSNTATILDLIDSEQILLNLETKYWRAAADAWLARWKLTTLSGGLWLD